MKVSICLSTYNKPEALQNTLASIATQRVSFDYETIVVDDGSPEPETQRICEDHGVNYTRIERKPIYRNPACARNLAYKRASGEIIVAQSDDVIHATPNTLQQLVDKLKPNHFVIATVVNVDAALQPYSDTNGKGYGDQLSIYTSPERTRPLFFLGTLYRSDLYAIGGNDEDFVDPSREDVWFSLCLMHGLGLQPIYSTAKGLHQHHSHTTDYDAIKRSRFLFNQKVREAEIGRASCRERVYRSV